MASILHANIWEHSGILNQEWIPGENVEDTKMVQRKIQSNYFLNVHRHQNIFIRLNQIKPRSNLRGK